MKQLLLVLLGFACMLFIACEDETTNEKTPNNGTSQEEELEDVIVHVDLSQDLILQPVDSFSLHPSGLCQEIIPFPSDSSDRIQLDLDQDGVNDLAFVYTTYYDFVSASTPCANYNSKLEVSNLSTGTKTMVGENWNKISKLYFGDTINSDQQFEPNSLIYFDQASAPFTASHFHGEGYIGFRLPAGELGWIKINFERNSFKCTIIEYAYNETIDSNITAGQIE